MLSGSPENWIKMSGNYSRKYYYRNINGKYSYTEASNFCNRSGAKLAEPIDRADNKNLGLTFREFEGTFYIEQSSFASGISSSNTQNQLIFEIV